MARKAHEKDLDLPSGRFWRPCSCLPCPGKKTPVVVVEFGVVVKIASLCTLQKFGSQDEDSFPSEPSSFPQAPGAGMPAPELVHVSQRSLSQLESVRGFVGHSHISPAKVRAKKLREPVGAPEVAGGLFGSGQKPLAVGGRLWAAAAAGIIAGGKQCWSRLTPRSLVSYLPDLCFTVKV